MRLDKYLKVSRIIKRRTVANEACDAGRVLVNGKQARASYDVKEGDVLELQLGERTLKAQVLSVTEYAKKEQAGDMYHAALDCRPPLRAASAGEKGMVTTAVKIANCLGCNPWRNNLDRPCISLG